MNLTKQQSAALILGLVAFFMSKVLWSAGKSTVLILTVIAGAGGYWLASQKPFAFQTQWQGKDATPDVGF